MGTFASARAYVLGGSLQGTSFGKYRLMALLGRGGMGEVWRAYDTVLDRTVAIKILPAQISRDEGFRLRFRREAHAATRLNSPHVIPIHTHGEIDGRLFVDMRLIEGHDLQFELNRGPLAPARAIHVIDQVARGLRAAHRAGLIHRDVKPSNILLDDDDFAYLIDFGIARVSGQSGVTTGGGFVGTFHYMAPERFNSGVSDARSDIYSLTCVLYECLTGQRPFPGESLEEQFFAHLSAPPPRPSGVNPALPTAIDPVIAKGLAKNAETRYATAVELARCARQAITAPIPQPSPRPPVRDSGRRDSPPRNQLMAVTMPRPQQVPAAKPAPPAARPPSTPPPPPRRPRRWLKRLVLTFTVLLVMGAVSSAAAWVYLARHDRGSASEPVTMPFGDLDAPDGVSVDSEDTLYVSDTMHNQVKQLRARSHTATVLPFGELHFPTGVTVDGDGAVYVADSGNNRVLKLIADAPEPVQLAFDGLSSPTGVTVDQSGTVYVADSGNDRVVALPVNATSQKLLPFPGISNPTGLTVDADGTIYVFDGGNRQVLKLPANSSVSTALPLHELSERGGVTLGRDGAVYVTDSGNNRVLVLAADATRPTTLSAEGLNYPWGVAIGSTGRVYVTGHNNRVLSLPAG